MGPKVSKEVREPSLSRVIRKFDKVKLNSPVKKKALPQSLPENWSDMDYKDVSVAMWLVHFSERSPLSWAVQMYRQDPAFLLEAWQAYLAGFSDVGWAMYLVRYWNPLMPTEMIKMQVDEIEGLNVTQKQVEECVGMDETQNEEHAQTSQIQPHFLLDLNNGQDWDGGQEKAWQAATVFEEEHTYTTESTTEKTSWTVKKTSKL